MCPLAQRARHSESANTWNAEVYWRIEHNWAFYLVLSRFWILEMYTCFYIIQNNFKLSFDSLWFKAYFFSRWGESHVTRASFKLWKVRMETVFGRTSAVPLRSISVTTSIAWGLISEVSYEYRGFVLQCKTIARNNFLWKQLWERSYALSQIEKRELWNAFINIVKVK